MDEQIAISKVVAKARNWASSRRAKARAIGPEKERARYRHLQDGNELAEAVEKLEKGWAAQAPPAADRSK